MASKLNPNYKRQERLVSVISTMRDFDLFGGDFSVCVCVCVCVCFAVFLKMLRKSDVEFLCVCNMQEGEGKE